MAGRLHVYYTEDTIQRLWEAANFLGIDKNDNAASHLSEEMVRHVLPVFIKQLKAHGTLAELKELKKGKKKVVFEMDMAEFFEIIGEVRTVKMKGFYAGKEVSQEDLDAGKKLPEVRQESL